jgi:Family of unknown function (DUF5989)
MPPDRSISSIVGFLKLGFPRASMLSFVVELWEFMRVRKKYWLLPVITLIAFFSAFVVLTKGSAVAPFVYTLF